MEHNCYVAKRRARFNGISGPVNIPYGTSINTKNGFLIYNENPICAVGSANATDFFSQNDDGYGLKRGELTSRIKARLEKKDKNHQARWDMIWDNALCQKYKMVEHDDHWIWNIEFYDAPLCDLQMIAKLIEF